jgi:glutamate synthase (ferredoxin)
MTGGITVVLGRTGRNFGEGMSGGLAYVLDETDDLATRCNHEMVTLERLTDPTEIALLRSLVNEHAQRTGSKKARHLLANWAGTVGGFVKVFPDEYRRVLSERAEAEIAEGAARGEAQTQQAAEG